jgi:diaminohydroxyphosphoribosylaminopyrimidine deaminase/5-amino-6-(5-phosphoribosylamino)uracil reductase
VTLKAALSLDAKVAAGRGQRTRLSGPDALAEIHRERAEVDAIAIGSETLMIDDPVLTARGAFRDLPLARVIFDRRLRTPANASIFSTLDQGPVIVVTDNAGAGDARADALERAGAIVDRLAPDAGGVLPEALRRLASRGITSLVVEGGPTLHDAFWRAGLVDRVELFLSPIVLGSGGVEWMPLPQGAIAGLANLTARSLGDDVMIEGDVHRPD